jgi:chromosome segregation ATPase
MSRIQAISWYRQQLQWSWIAAGLLLTTLSIFLLREAMDGRSLEIRLNAARADLTASHVQNEDTRVTVRTYDELIRQYDAQRDVLIREIGDFRREIEVLSAKTKRLELVAEKLVHLEHEFQRFRTEKEGFLKTMALLEKPYVK